MGLPLDALFRSTITRSTRTVSRRGFGTALIAAYHTAWLDRTRTYSDPSELLEDLVDGGYTASQAAAHPAYLAAVALCSQSPRVERFKVGRRVGAPTQSLRLTPSTPAATEVYSITVGGVTFEVTADATPSVAEITAALALLINADPDAIIASGVTSTTGVQNLDEGDFNGIRAGGPFAPPRNATITLNAHADWDATTIVVSGFDDLGRAQTEDFLVPNGGGVTLTGTKLWSEITGVTIPAQSGTNGTLQMGVGVLFENADLDVTATDGTTHVDIVVDVAGKWFAYTDISANLSIEDRTAEPGTTLATDLGGIQTADADWYGLILADGQSSAQILAAAAWLETQVKLYLAHTIDSDVEADVTTDVASDLKALGYLRSWPFYSRGNHRRFPDAALMGVLFPLPVGSADWEYKTPVGIVADDMSTTVIERLIGTPSSPQSGKRATIFVEVLPTGVNSGESVTLGGLTSGGEWADVVQGIDFLNSLIQEQAINYRLSNPRPPFTAAGIDVFEGRVRAALLTAAAAPHNILVPESITTQATAVEDVSDADKQARFYATGGGVRWDAELQGSIRTGSITGTVHA